MSSRRVPPFSAAVPVQRFPLFVVRHAFSYNDLFYLFIVIYHPSSECMLFLRISTRFGSPMGGWRELPEPLGPPGVVLPVQCFPVFGGRHSLWLRPRSSYMFLYRFGPFGVIKMRVSCFSQLLLHVSANIDFPNFIALFVLGKREYFA